LIFEITRYCPARCPFCTVPKDNARMPLELYEGALDLFVRRLGPVDVVLSGGEPSTVPILDLYIVAAKRRGCAVTVVTNGFNPHKLLGALKAGADLIEVSLDYASRKQDEVRRVPGVYENVKWLIERAKPRVVVRSTLLPDNLDDVVKIAETYPDVPVFVMPVRGMGWRPPVEWIERLSALPNVAVSDSCPVGINSFVLTPGRDQYREIDVLPCIFYRARLGTLRDFTDEELDEILEKGRKLPRFPCEGGRK